MKEQIEKLDAETTSPGEDVVSKNDLEKEQEQKGPEDLNPNPQSTPTEVVFDVDSLKVGDRIAFTPKGGKEKTLTVDEAFLKLPKQENDFYKEYGYRKL